MSHSFISSKAALQSTFPPCFGVFRILPFILSCVFDSQPVAVVISMAAVTLKGNLFGDCEYNWLL